MAMSNVNQAKAVDLSDRQHRFWRGCLTLGTIDKIIEAYQGKRGSCPMTRPFMILVILNVKNAFNSVQWIDILEPLQVFHVLSYLLWIVNDYLSKWELAYESTEGMHRWVVSTEVAQGLILRSNFWNVMYDRLLAQKMLPRPYLEAYTDDAATIITAQTKEAAQMTLNQVMKINKVQGIPGDIQNVQYCKSKWDNTEYMFIDCTWWTE